MLDLLHDIGWTISESGILKTEDALIGERYFPSNTAYDAYITIREILATASENIIIVDGYVGSSLLLMLKALPARNLAVKILTMASNLRPDFLVEATTFRKQIGHISLEVRTRAGFHDRFIVIDGDAFYHVGASIKDAGKGAFMISRIEDQTNINSLKKSIREAWVDGEVLQLQ